MREDLKNFCTGVAPKQICQSRSVGRANRLDLAKEAYLFREGKVLQVDNSPVTLLEKMSYLRLVCQTARLSPSRDKKVRLWRLGSYPVRNQLSAQVLDGVRIAEPGHRSRTGKVVVFNFQMAFIRLAGTGKKVKQPQRVAFV